MYSWESDQFRRGSVFYWWVYEETRFQCSLRVPDRLTFVVNNGAGRLSQSYTNFSVGFGRSEICVLMVGL